MLSKTFLHALLGVGFCATQASAFLGAKLGKPLQKRQYPAAVEGATTFTTPSGVKISYKQPGKEGICETTPGVDSYSGYIEIAPDAHVFFWFFESRRDPQRDPVTLWLNGGPGSDSLIGLFQELGPCSITPNLTSQINPYAWNEVSNMLFLSQPIGTGFGYGEEALGSQNNYTGAFQNATIAPPTGRWPIINASAIDTTELAAVSAWHVLQGFYSGICELDSDIVSKDFNLFTESYGGHYGPQFSDYFYKQNELIKNGTVSGIPIQFNTLGIINGIIDERTQVPYFAEFATNNTYGIKAVNDTIYNYMNFATYMTNGCLDQIDSCRYSREVSPPGFVVDSICAEAGNMCRDNVEGLYYAYGGRGVYDIRHPYDDPTPPEYFQDYLNQAYVQQAIGVDLNYTESNTEIYYAFQNTGDFVFDDFIPDLEYLLDQGVRVSLMYGDADYICNWFGGQAVSLAINYTHSTEFAAAGYTPLLVGGTEYGETRQYGNFSFTRVYESGHEGPYYQPVAYLQLFNRTIFGYDIATGSSLTAPDTKTNGTAFATHTEPFVALPSTTSSVTAASAAATSVVPILAKPFKG